MYEPPSADDTLVNAALKVLLQPSPWKKAEFTQQAVELWRSGAISRISNGPQEASRVPNRPHRADDKVTLVAPRDMPKLGRGGTLASRQALLHSLVHIENWAVDLSWDIIARFGSDPSYQLPKAFFDDFVQVAADECSHFSLLCRRLEELGSHYGALPAHDGLWESASQTAHSLPARLAVEHCVHEARGLDVLPSTVHKFRSNGDEQTASLLEDVIYAEEISHCSAGVRWLQHLHRLAHGQSAFPIEQAAHDLSSLNLHPAEAPTAYTAEQVASADLEVKQHQQEQEQLQVAAGVLPAGSSCEGDQPKDCRNWTALPPAGTADRPASAAEGPADWVKEARQYDTVEAWFHALIRKHFKGNLKPPFNDAARARAGFGVDWYLPLASESATAAAAAENP